MINSTFQQKFNNLNTTGIKATTTTEKGQSFERVQLPDKNRNYTLVDKKKVDFYVNQGEKALPQLDNILKNSKDEGEVTETLYIVDQMIDKGVKGVDKMYPTLSKYNDTKSPNVQTFLAGIYRKTKVPDAFGPLVKMLIQDSINPPKSPQAFDPTEEVGGAILSYLA